MKEKKGKAGILCLIAVAVLLAGCDSTKKAQKDAAVIQKTESVQEDIGSEEKEEEKAEKKSDLSQLYVITKIDTQNRVIEAKCVLDGKWRTCNYSGATYFYDKFGQSVTVEDVSCGKIVTLKENEQTGNLAEIRFTEDVWEYEDIKNPQIDTEKQIITINGEKFFYGSHYWVYSGESEVNLSDISDQDQLTVSGIDKKILSIRITTGHGTVKLNHTDLFVGGWLKMGDIVCKITKDMTFTAAEGTYELSVANDGYGDVKTVTVEKNKTLEIDLNEYKGSGPKQCMITFHCDVSGAVLKINGKQVDYTQPLQLRYGTYAVNLSADGYETISEYLIVNSPTADITLTMTGKGSDAGEETEEKGSTSNESPSQTSQPQQVVTPGELAGTLAGTKTGEETTGDSANESVSGNTNNTGAINPFADTGKTENDTLNSSGSLGEKTEQITSLWRDIVK